MFESMSFSWRTSRKGALFGGKVASASSECLQVKQQFAKNGARLALRILPFTKWMDNSLPQDVLELVEAEPHLFIDIAPRVMQLNRVVIVVDIID